MRDATLPRTEASEDAFRRAETHAVEQNVQVMQCLADSTLMNNRTIHDLEANLRSVVGERLVCR